MTPPYKLCKGINIEEHEQWTFSWMHRLCRPDWACCIDVGAGEGAPYAHYLLHRLNGGDVYAFEPGPHFERLVKLGESSCWHREDAPKLHPMRCALTKKGDTGTRRMQYYGYWTLLPEGDGRTHSIKGQRNPFSVTFATLDSFELDPNFIKIDVDGYEGRVLQGAEETIERARPYVVIELCAWGHREIGDRIEDMIQFMLNRDYVFQLPMTTEDTLTSVMKHVPQENTAVNAVLTPREKIGDL